VSPPHAGGLRHYYQEWEVLTSDPVILQMVHGVHLPIARPVSQLDLPRPICFSTHERQLIQFEIEALKRKGILESATPSPGQFISNIFLRKKKSGKVRVILDLSAFNAQLPHGHFKMESFHTTLQLIQTGAFMASIDLEDTYYSVPIHPPDGRYRRFYWINTLYQYTCLPNGLAPAPRLFTKLLKPVFAHLRSRGLLSSVYLDDSLLLGATASECSINVTTTVYLLQNLGFNTNEDKSVLQPVQKLEYLGCVIDSRSMTVKLTHTGKTKILKFAKQIKKQHHHVKIRALARLVGLIVASDLAVTMCFLHYRQLERAKIEALTLSRGNFNAYMTLPSSAGAEIHWWLDNIRQAYKPVRQEAPALILHADASGQGWGAVCQEVTANGL